MGIILFISEDCNHTYFKSISCYCHIFISLGLMNLLLISYKTCSVIPFESSSWIEVLCVYGYISPPWDHPTATSSFAGVSTKPIGFLSNKGAFTGGLGSCSTVTSSGCDFDLSSTGALVARAVTSGNHPVQTQMQCLNSIHGCEWPPQTGPRSKIHRDHFLFSLSCRI